MCILPLPTAISAQCGRETALAARAHCGQRVSRPLSLLENNCHLRRRVHRERIFFLTNVRPSSLGRSVSQLAALEGGRPMGNGAVTSQHSGAAFAATAMSHNFEACPPSGAEMHHPELDAGRAQQNTSSSFAQLHREMGALISHMRQSLDRMSQVWSLLATQSEGSIGVHVGGDLRDNGGGRSETTAARKCGRIRPVRGQASAVPVRVDPTEPDAGPFADLAHRLAGSARDRNMRLLGIKSAGVLFQIRDL